MGKQPRLYFIDALRAFAILMMLQGHFISGLLDPTYKDTSNSIYNFWVYCRGFTAPVFFTITGWVFSFLLLRSPTQGKNNPRIKKGLKRTLELLIWGYLLRLNLPMVFNGEINESFYLPDVLQIIGLSLSFIIFVYLFFGFLKRWTSLVFLCIGISIFITQPLYVDIQFTSLPHYIASYLTKANKGVFYLFPWLGYVCIGSFIAYIFNTKTKQLWIWGLGFLTGGYWLIFNSSSFLIAIEFFSGIDLFRKVAYNNFLFIRLGDVFVLFGIFILLNNYLKKGLWTSLGSKTLEIYIVHYFILYGSLFGVGLYKYFKYSWTLTQSILGAVAFMIVCSGLVLLEAHYRPKIRTFLKEMWVKV